MAQENRRIRVAIRIESDHPKDSSSNERIGTEMGLALWIRGKQRTARGMMHSEIKKLPELLLGWVNSIIIPAYHAGSEGSDAVSDECSL